MKIKKILIDNFKSFDNTEIEFGNVNLIIGANAAGKSNFIQIFELLKLIKNKGVQKAMSEMGDIEALKNFNSKKRNFEIKIEIEINEEINREEINASTFIARRRDKILYEIEFIIKGDNKFQIREDLKFIEFLAEYVNGNETKKFTDNFEYGVKNKFGKFETYPNELKFNSYTLSSGELFKPNIENPFHRKFIEELNKSYTEKSVLEYPGIFIPRELFDFGIMKVDSNIAKQSNKERGETKLLKDGANLTRIIYNILKDKEQAEEFYANVSRIFDFIEKIEVINVEGMLYLKVKEYDNQQKTDGKLLSDGTIHLITNIVALYYQNNSILFIEEPENGLHPKLISKIIDILYSVAEFLDKQIIVSTHNPVLLKSIYYQTGLNDIFTIQRKNGFSFIKKPTIKSFEDFLTEFNEDALSEFINEIGIDNLFIQNRIK